MSTLPPSRRVLPLNQIIAGTMRAVHAMSDAQQGAAALAAFAAGAGDPPAEGRLPRTVLRKSHADFSPRAWHALSLSASGSGCAWVGPPAAVKVQAASPALAVPGAPSVAPPARPAVPEAEQQNAAAAPAAAAAMPADVEVASAHQPGRVESQLPCLPLPADSASASGMQVPPPQQQAWRWWSQGQHALPLRLRAPCATAAAPPPAEVAAAAHLAAGCL